MAYYYFAEENVPLPMEKTKHIIRKCPEDEVLSRFMRKNVCRTRLNEVSRQ